MLQIIKLFTNIFKKEAHILSSFLVYYVYCDRFSYNNTSGCK